MATELNILINDQSIRHPLIKENIAVVDLDKLEPIYTKIFIGDALTCIGFNDVLNFLSKVKSKLLPGGQIQLEEYDLMELSLALINDTISSADFNNVMRHRQQTVTLFDACDVLVKAGFKILSKDLDALKHTIIATL